VSVATNPAFFLPERRIIENPVTKTRSSAWGRWARRVALVAAAAVLLFVFGWVPYFIGGVATTRRFEFPDKENAGLTPASFDLASEDVLFHSVDGVELHGWWVPADEPNGTVVMVHGLNRTRIQMVKKVPFVHELGWNALLFDLRHHGASGGEATTYGVREKDDVRAAVELARERSPGPVVVWGVSLGAFSVVMAAAEDLEVAAVICDSGFRNLRDSVAHHIRLFRRWRWWLRAIPTWPLTDEVLFWMERKGGFDPDAADVLSAAARIEGRPALFVSNSDDQRMPKEIAFELQAAAGPAAEVLIVPGQTHGRAWRDGTAAYQAAAASLLEAAQGTRPGEAAQVAVREDLR
jgi:pimeloyl-ACP methyl ester carboxylesterase